MGFNCTFCKNLGAKFSEDSSTFVDNTYETGSACNWTNCSNMALLTKNKKISFPKHSGCLSIKYPLKGIEHYEIDSKRSIKVDFSNYLILNSHQDYNSEFYLDSDNEILCIFFQERFVNKMLGYAFQKTSEMLEDFKDPEHRSDFVFDTLHKKSSGIDIIMQWFKKYIDSSMDDEFSFQQKFIELFFQILSLNSDLVKQIDKLKYQKKNTREEIYRRLQKGREYIESNFTKKIMLGEVADSSNLSQYHFARKFQELFGVSPHYYLLQKRVDYASRLIKKNYSITEACYSSGFNELSHFSRVFKQIKGLPPNNYKSLTIKKAILDKKPTDNIHMLR